MSITYIIYDYKKKMKAILSIKNLPEQEFYFTLEETFRDRLFSKLIKKYNNWSKVCNILDNLLLRNLYDMRKSYQFINLSLLKKISRLVDVPLERFEENIIATKRGGRGNHIFISWPIEPSTDLASLVGHAISDGSISFKDKYRFRYGTNQRELNLDVYINILRSFGVTSGKGVKKENNFIEDKYAPIVGYILYRLGVPLGNKVKKEFDVPLWIKKGNKEIKRRFLQAIFDDEGTVKRVGIKLDYSKLLKLRKSHEKFLNSIKKMLKEFNIESNILTKEIYSTKKDNNKRIGMQIFISHRKNLINFSKNIRFLHQKKMRRLEDNLVIYTRRRYSDGGKSKRKIYYAIKGGKNTITILKKYFKKSDSTLRHHFYQLEKDGLIKRIGQDNNKSIIWKISD